jgi:hypothetical protein
MRQVSTGKPISEKNQAAIINAVMATMGNDNLQQQEKKKIENGICFMLSIEWLRQIIEKGGITAELKKFNQGLDTADEKERNRTLAYYKQIANNQFAYRRRDEGKIPGKPNTITLVNEFFVSLCSNKQLKSPVTCTSSDAAQLAKHFDACEKEKKGKCYLLGYVYQDGGHKTAFTIDEEGKYWFYDPNSDVWVADSVGDILQYLESWYRLSAKESCVIDICEVVRA